MFITQILFFLAEECKYKIIFLYFALSAKYEIYSNARTIEFECNKHQTCDNVLITRETVTLTFVYSMVHRREIKTPIFI